MKRLLTTTLLATAVGFAAPAMAQDINLAGGYVGASVGMTDYSIDEHRRLRQDDIGGKTLAVTCSRRTSGTKQNIRQARSTCLGLREAKSSLAPLVGQYPVDNPPSANWIRG
jgi:hypothetical protein